MVTETKDLLNDNTEDIRNHAMLDEHENCGIGAIVNINGKDDHAVVSDALKIVEHLEHRAGKDALGETGDGVGILTRIPHEFFVKECTALGMELPGKRGYGGGRFFYPVD